MRDADREDAIVVHLSLDIHPFHWRSGMRTFITGTVVAIFLTCTQVAHADIVTYYVGLDSRGTPFAAPAGLGGGDYPDNPNLNHLSLLFHHGDHYHALGVHNYSGPAAAPVLNDTNANNRTPEISTGLPPVELRRGAGAFDGLYRSGMPSNAPQNLEYGNYEFRNVHSLAGEDDITYNSSAGRWNSPFETANIALELVSASAGLNIAFGASPTMDLTVGGRQVLGLGNQLFSAMPTFWVDGAAPRGTYTAEFRLVDETGTYGDSGRFYIDVAVPEPNAMALTVFGALVFLGARWRRQSRA